MEKYEIIGIKRSSGTYQGQSFDNMTFSCIRSADTSKGEQGTIASLFKVKSKYLESVPSIGDMVSPIYDRWQNVIGFI